jgi:hypothetical protein
MRYSGSFSSGEQMPGMQIFAADGARSHVRLSSPRANIEFWLFTGKIVFACTEGGWERLEATHSNSFYKKILGTGKFDMRLHLGPTHFIAHRSFSEFFSWRLFSKT